MLGAPMPAINQLNSDRLKVYEHVRTLARPVDRPSLAGFFD